MCWHAYELDWHDLLANDAHHRTNSQLLRREHDTHKTLRYSKLANFSSKKKSFFHLFSRISMYQLSIHPFLYIGLFSQESPSQLSLGSRWIGCQAIAIYFHLCPNGNDFTSSFCWLKSTLCWLYYTFIASGLNELSAVYGPVNSLTQPFQIVISVPPF